MLKLSPADASPASPRGRWPVAEIEANLFEALAHPGRIRILEAADLRGAR